MKLFLFLFCLFLIPVSAEVPVKTGVFFDVLGSVVINGLPAQSGSIVCCYTPSGVLCGQNRVRYDGMFGIMHVYADDPQTPAADGIRKGEKLVFTVNGEPAVSETDVIFQMPYETERVSLVCGKPDTTAPQVLSVSESFKLVTISFSEPLKVSEAIRKANCDCGDNIMRISSSPDAKSLYLQFEDAVPSKISFTKITDLSGNFIENLQISVPVSGVQ